MSDIFAQSDWICGLDSADLDFWGPRDLGVELGVKKTWLHIAKFVVGEVLISSPTIISYHAKNHPSFVGNTVKNSSISLGLWVGSFPNTVNTVLKTPCGSFRGSSVLQFSWRRSWILLVEALDVDLATLREWWLSWLRTTFVWQLISINVVIMWWYTINHIINFWWLWQKMDDKIAGKRIYHHGNLGK